MLVNSELEMQKRWDQEIHSQFFKMKGSHLRKGRKLGGVFVGANPGQADRGFCVAVAISAGAEIRMRKQGGRQVISSGISLS